MEEGKAISGAPAIIGAALRKSSGETVAPDGGLVALDGRHIGKTDERRRSALQRTRFGFVFQDGQLLAERPADENVALPLMLGSMRRRDAVAKAREWLGLSRVCHGGHLLRPPPGGDRRPDARLTEPARSRRPCIGSGLSLRLATRRAITHRE